MLFFVIKSLLYFCFSKLKHMGVRSTVLCTLKLEPDFAPFQSSGGNTAKVFTGKPCLERNFWETQESSIFFPFFSCMCGKFTCIHVNMWNSEDSLGCHSSEAVHHVILRQGVSLAYALQSLLLCLCCPITGFTSTHHHTWLFTQILGIQLKHTTTTPGFSQGSWGSISITHHHMWLSHGFWGSNLVPPV